MCKAMDVAEYEVVAPHGGAWIEILHAVIIHTNPMKSPLTEGRGLKSALSRLQRY